MRDQVRYSEQGDPLILFVIFVKKFSHITAVFIGYWYVVRYIALA